LSLNYNKKSMVDTSEILKKYSRKFESEISSFSPTESSEYSRFKKEMVQPLSSYERWAKSLGNLISIKVAEKDRVKIQRNLDIAHLDVTPSQVLALAALSMLAVFFSTIIISTAIYLINPEVPNVLLFAFLGILSSLFLFYYTYSMPERLANAWRLKASSQMVPAVLYVVVI